MNGLPLASFAIAMPPGWVRLPAGQELRWQLQKQIETIVSEALPASLPRDRTEPWRGEIRKRLTRAVLDAEEAGATAVYLPAHPVNGVVIPASFIESEVEDDGRGTPVELISDIVGDAESNATRCVIDGASGARIDRTITKAQPKGDWPEISTRQIVYTIEVPHREGRWIVLSFSAIFGDNPSAELSEALVSLFDALMLTFRWTGVPGRENTDLETRLYEIASR